MKELIGKKPAEKVEQIAKDNSYTKFANKILKIVAKKLKSDAKNK